MCLAGVSYSNAFFGSGTGQIFLDDVQCSSSSSQLLECRSRPILDNNCAHSSDAGVGCEGKVHTSLCGSCIINWMYTCTQGLLHVCLLVCWLVSQALEINTNRWA